jgi:hypothetical protein
MCGNPSQPFTLDQVKQKHQEETEKIQDRKVFIHIARYLIRCFECDFFSAKDLCDLYDLINHCFTRTSSDTFTRKNTSTSTVTSTFNPHWSSSVRYIPSDAMKDIQNLIAWIENEHYHQSKDLFSFWSQKNSHFDDEYDSCLLKLQKYDEFLEDLMENAYIMALDLDPLKKEEQHSLLLLRKIERVMEETEDLKIQAIINKNAQKMIDSYFDFIDSYNTYFFFNQSVDH